MEVVQTLRRGTGPKLSRHMEIAAEFCQLAGAPDLLEYLGLPGDSAADEALAKLKARRKYMQGMQSNPKYRKEALFLIKHLSSLSKALEDPALYLADARQRAESVHLPILEMTIKGVLAGGQLSADQESYLRRNATELGISVASFEDLLHRLCAEAGVPVPTADSNAADLAEKPTQGEDFYSILGVSPTATLTEIRGAYEAGMQALRAQQGDPSTEERIVQLDVAWSVLSDPRAREQYLVSKTRTGPPARQRDAVPNNIDTAPPVRQRSNGQAPVPAQQLYSAPTGSSRLEVLTEPRVALQVTGMTQSVIRIRNGGSEPMTGRISCDVPWAQVEPRQIDPDLEEQDIQVTINPGLMPGLTGVATVKLVTDRGRRAEVRFDVSQRNTLVPFVLGGLAISAFMALAAWFLLNPGGA